MTSGLIPVHKRTLTPAQYGDLADVPPEIEWLANITNEKTRRAYKTDVTEFSSFTGLNEPAQLRTDRRKELTLRAHGLQVVRYDWPLVTGAPEEVGADLLRQLAAASLTR